VEDIVKCYSGYKYGEIPKSFFWEDKWIQISDIIARWRTENGNKFRVETSNKDKFDLSYDESKNFWSIKPL